MDSTHHVLSDQCLAIIAEETGTPGHELVDKTEFADLGLHIDHVLARAITDRIAEVTALRLEPSVFKDFPTVHSFLEHVAALSCQHESGAPTGNVTTDPNIKSTGSSPFQSEPRSRSPLVFALQGDHATATKTLFLFPDGSGYGMAYARLPRLGPHIAVYGVNSPFLRTHGFDTTIESLAAIWVDAIRAVQPHGPYILGGWSAGGYYSTEVTRLLLRAGESVESVVLIDSPCRPEYEALPLEIFHFLAENNLMGNARAAGTKAATLPQWFVDHFSGTIKTVEEYRPEPLEDTRGTGMPRVFIIWASEGVFESEEAAVRSGVDRSRQITRHLLGPRPKFAPYGWERMYPRTSIRWATVSATHFTITQPPHSDMLGTLLRQVVDDTACHSQTWTSWP